MSRWGMSEEQRRGYDDREDAGRFSNYPYSEGYDYRQGWEARESDERRERAREEERELERAQEQAEEERRHQAYLENQREEEQQLQEHEEARLASETAGEPLCFHCGLEAYRHQMGDQEHTFVPDAPSSSRRLWQLDWDDIELAKMDLPHPSVMHRRNLKCAQALKAMHLHRFNSRRHRYWERVWQKWGGYDYDNLTFLGYLK